MKSTLLVRSILTALGAILLFCSPNLSAQQPSQQEPPPKQESSSKQRDPDAPDTYKPQPKKIPPSGAEAPAFDPLRAEKDIEVGRYYMRKGDLDAAIDRFLDATQVRPNYALPFRLLAGAQDKKGRKKDAVKSYTRYLEIYPQAEDAGKVRKRIDKLLQELGKDSRKSP